jgi:hypothetical protein
MPPRASPADRPVSWRCATDAPLQLAERAPTDTFRFREDRPMRVLVILGLALLLAGCNGDRMKQGMNVRQAQPQSSGLLT